MSCYYFFYFGSRKMVFGYVDDIVNMFGDEYVVVFINIFVVIGEVVVGVGVEVRIDEVGGILLEIG